MSKEASKERMGREPLRQLPVKWSSSIVCTREEVRFAWNEGKRGDLQFCMCIFAVGPFGALLIHRYKSLPFLASKKKTLLQL